MDLNSDMGESFGRWHLGDDERMLGIVSSANVACGFHAGDPVGISETVGFAAANGVVIGAHPGYRDLDGFGRRDLAASPKEITADVIYQIGAVDGIARSVGSRVRYVKPHGALYNRIAVDEERALAVVAAVKAYSQDLAVMALAGSVFANVAERHGLRVIAEAFADRNYRPDGTLVSRREPEAVIGDVDRISERMRRLAESGELEAVDGSTLQLGAESICVHSDSPGAIAIAEAVRATLDHAGITVRSPLAAASVAGE